ncbi:amino acid permease [Flavobacterium jejuense]|uniref:Amino acid permease n=1 Tax=Flavobacterium jejuense TaxID=1544455 RepID=A0ABX0IM12_9FLAO|nr:amino acid permease [Flavobacterium jejuense]NHN24758.1 amino acid permease [Flavobacterium jejuense]
MENKLQSIKANFGTLPVFLTAISTILGAVMFLRFGYAVGEVGFMGTLLIILIGHLVTIPTAMALAEIATNQKVEGGGEYFIISRSFGLNIGSSIGLALYLSQAISVAFYVIAFAESFEAIKPWISAEFGYTITDNRIFSIPALLVLIWLMITKGADLGMKALYIVVAILFVSLVMFFLGSTDYSSTFDSSLLFQNIDSGKGFFFVFAIIFPAFTGMTAGVGLSGDLKDPKKSIPMGTLAATIIGMIIYVFIALKLSYSASPSDLISDQLIMSKIALWGPIIPLGLAAATISSALGSFMVAPRTLQAIGADNVIPNLKVNTFISKGTAKNNEPKNATIITSVIALVFVLMGDVNAVAEVISMFFMVTYGSLCLISFMQHFAADPSYRPSFKSKWYLSLLGAILCVYLMFKVNTVYAIASILLMVAIYFYITFNNSSKKGMANIFQGVIHQFNRNLQVFLQKSDKENSDDYWRPGVICLNKDSFERLAAFDIMKWISYRYGFGTFIHFEKGYFSKAIKQEADQKLHKLIEMANTTKSNVFLETIINPSNTGAIVQAIQQPGISGHENNMMLFEFKKGTTEWLTDVVDNYNLIASANYDLCILASSDRNFGYRNEIHVWIKKEDYENANLMILLSYIILGHPDWKKAEIKIFAAVDKANLETEKAGLIKLTSTGRLPISSNNIIVIPIDESIDKVELINKKSKMADLTILGFHESSIKTKGIEQFNQYDAIGNVLFVNTLKNKMIK